MIACGISDVIDFPRRTRQAANAKTREIEADLNNIEKANKDNDIQ